MDDEEVETFRNTSTGPRETGGLTLGLGVKCTRL